MRSFDTQFDADTYANQLRAAGFDVDVYHDESSWMVVINPRIA